MSERSSKSPRNLSSTEIVVRYTVDIPLNALGKSMSTKSTKHLPKFYLHFTYKYQHCSRKNPPVCVSLLLISWAACFQEYTFYTLLRNTSPLCVKSLIDKKSLIKGTLEGISLHFSPCHQLKCQHQWRWRSEKKCR